MKRIIFFLICVCLSLDWLSAAEHLFQNDIGKRNRLTRLFIDDTAMYQE